MMDGSAGGRLGVFNRRSRKSHKSGWLFCVVSSYLALVAERAGGLGRWGAAPRAGWGLRGPGGENCV